MAKKTTASCRNYLLLLPRLRLHYSDIATCNCEPKCHRENPFQIMTGLGPVKELGPGFTKRFTFEYNNNKVILIDVLMDVVFKTSSRIASGE